MRLFTKLFILSALAFLLPLGARALTAPAALWLNGDTDIPGAGSWWTYGDGDDESKKSHPYAFEKTGDGIFLAKNVTLKGSSGEASFKLYAQKGWGTEYGCTSGDRFDSEATITDADKSAAFKVASGIYNITANFNTGKVTVEKLSHLQAPAELYLDGNLTVGDWIGSHPVKFEKNGDVFTAKNVSFSNGNDQTCYFGLYDLSEWGASQYYSRNSDVTLSDGTDGIFDYATSEAANNKSFRVTKGTYNITVNFADASVKVQRTTAPSLEIPAELWLNGTMYGANSWGLHNSTHPVRFEKNGNVFTAKNVRFDNGDSRSEFALYNTPGWSDSKYFNASKTELDASNPAEIGYGTRGNNFSIENGTYDITVDFPNRTVSARKLDHYTAPERLFLNGQIAGRGAWSLNDGVHPVEFVRNGNVFTATNVPLDNADGTEADFSLYADSGFADDAMRCFPTDDALLSAGSPKSFCFGDKNYCWRNFKAKNGIYNITVDFAAGTLSLEEAGPFTAHDATFTMSFWEGPINDALRGSNQQASNIPFEYYETREADGHRRGVYRIFVADNIAANRFVSQMYLGGRFAVRKFSVDGDHVKVETKQNTDGYKTYFFDAHQTDVLVPVTDSFWCNNSRMEANLTVKAIYLRVDYDEFFENSSSDRGDADFLHVMLSSNGLIDTHLEEQRPLNSDSYSIAISDGSVYDALKRTRTGRIEVPFVRHNSAKEGYVIKLGRYITTEEAEKFTFMVNDRPVDVKFDVNATSTSVEAAQGSEGTIAAGLRFNQIILMVSGDRFDRYALWLADDSGARPENYDIYADNLPMMKVWGGDSSWQGLYNSSLTPSYSEGTVKYFAFEPVKSQNDKYTNLYYLDLGEGVKVRKADLSSPTTVDQFNIVDQDGFDISTPFQGSQFIYPGAWWCANPNLMVEGSEGREFQGHRFKDVPELPSRVDLAFNLPDDGGEETTIYGITLFKIIGRVYDIYARQVRERNLYYLYAHTSRPDASASPREKCEKTAPILLCIKNVERAASVDDYKAKIASHPDHPVFYATSEPELYTPVFSSLGFNDPHFSDSNRNCVLRLTDIVSSENDDINYEFAPSGMVLYPGNPEPFEFVDVTGTQRWSAPGTDDRLRVNKWSNYYAGDFDLDHLLNVYNPKRQYYKMVLGTNPDNVRYQVMSTDMSLMSRPRFDYSPAGENHDEADRFIYPVSDLSAVMLWRNDSKIRLTLTAGDSRIYKNIIDYGESGVPADQQLPDSEGFFAEGEAPFEVNIGSFVAHPATEVKALVEYINDKGNTIDHSDGSATTADLPVPAMESLSAEPVSYEYRKEIDGWDFTSDLSWSTDHGGDFPAHITVYNYDLTNQTDKDSFVPAELNESHNALVDSYSGNGAATLTMQNGPDFRKSTEEAEGKILATIGYRAKATYHYALPDGAAMLAFDTAPAASKRRAAGETNRYNTIADGFVDTPVSSAENLSDMPLAKAVFGITNEVLAIETPDADADAPAEYFTLQGIRISGTPEPGSIVIERRGSQVRKTHF